MSHLLLKSCLFARDKNSELINLKNLLLFFIRVICTLEIRKIKFMHKFNIAYIIAVLLFYNVTVANASNLSTQNSIALKRNQSIVYLDTEQFDKIKLSGLFMSELIASDHDQNKSGRFDSNKHYSTFCVPRVNLYAAANMNEWTTVHTGFNFAPTTTCSACGFGSKNDAFRFTKYEKIDEANIMFANLDQSPYFAKIGIHYLNYGHYSPNSIPATFTQLLTQTQAAGITLGYINQENGLNASVFSFTDKTKRGSTMKISNVGTQVGYIIDDELGKTEITLDWLRNIASSVNYIISSNSTCCGKELNPLNKSYRKAVSGLSFSTKKQILNWDTTIQITSALTKFHKGDVNWKESGAKPAAALIDIGYRFKAFGEKQNRIGASYQRSTQAVNIKGTNLRCGLPEHRIQGDYTIEAWKNIEFGVHLILDKDYKKKSRGTGKTSLTSLVTLIVRIF